MKKSINATPVHVPQRTCVACGKTEAKRQLVRLVRLDGGVVEVDLTGRKTGRGAYLCATAACWENVLKRDRLEHALRTSITSDNRERLLQYGLGLGEGAA
jgi:uncharacterized protein